MTRRLSPPRAGALLLASALVFLLAGDRGFTAVSMGIDPLEVLNLQVKPNVFVALDTSGSMEDLTNDNTSPYGGDHPRSKIFQAKQVLKAVFQANQSKASFMFGVYRFSTAADPRGNMDPGNTSPTGTPVRFVYAAQSWAAGTFPNPACTVDPTTCPSPNPATVTLPVQGPSPSMATTPLVVNSLYAYQFLQNSGNIFNNTLVFTETGGPTCTVQVAPKFYLNGAAVATAIQTAMNSCAGKSNTYSVFYGTNVWTLSSLTRAGTVATATTPTPHGFLAGDTITIAGATPAGYNGSFTILAAPAPTATTFAYTVASTLTTPATGVITATRAGGTANRFSFRSNGVKNFTLNWSNAASTIRGVLKAGTTDVAVTGSNVSTLGSDARINLLQRTATQTFAETVDPDGASTTLTPTLDKPSPTRPITTYNMDAGKYWNGETVFVDSSGNSCDIALGPTTNPPSVTLELTTNCANGAASGDPTNKGIFSWGGALVKTGAGTCQGLTSLVPLIPCNQLTPPQYNNIGPFLDNQVPLTGTGAISGYTEQNNGTGIVSTTATLGSGVIASSNTPLAQSINDVAGIFGGNGSSTGLWWAGQATPTLDAIRLHLNPKEKTIFILVTDGDQNCTPFVLGGSAAGAPYSPTTIIQDDAAALGTAAAAQKLYNPDTIANKGNGANAGTVNTDGTINGDPAASVTTYLVTYGAGASKTRSDWIAWGGSGMRRALGTFSGQDTWTTVPTAAERAACKTCIDSFQAPDPDTLAAVLTKVINQGASSGEFSAQQSLTDSVYELAGNVPQGTAPAAWSPFNPRNRYDPLVPHRIVSTFSLPLFTGQIRAYTQGGPAALNSTDADCAYTIVTDPSGNQVVNGDACRRWSANDKLVDRVSVGMAAACPVNAAAGAAGGQCTFAMLWNGASYSNVGSAAGVGIRRRIFTTSQNGVFGPSVDQLIAGQSPFRVALWPPQTTGVSPAVAPADDTTQGLFDGELGLPLDTDPTTDAVFVNLRTTYKACMGNNLPATCPPTTQTTGFSATHIKRARRETREMLLAFLAGASFLADASSNPQRVAATNGPYTNQQILFTPRTSILAESTLATPAIVGPPQEETPDATTWKPEYQLYRDGPRDHSDPTKEPDGVASFGATMVRSGFGLRNPDRDGTNTSIGTVLGRIFYQNDARAMKPVMTVLYAGSNLALHAFRAGSSVTQAITTACDTTLPASTAIRDQEARGQGRNCGGEELWAYVPYDQLGKIPKRYVNNPQKRDPHDFVIARGIRFSDVFVPTPGTAVNPDDILTSKTVAGVNLGPIAGVWRKVMFVGRGVGGNYLSAIDVTAPGMFTDLALSDNIVGPIVLWNRGNPDTTNGQTGGTKSNTQADYDAYAKMGQTWSVPAISYVGRATTRPNDPSISNPNGKSTATSRKPKGADFVMYVGSGYGMAGQGTTFYSIDPLTGDIITSVDVDTVAAATYPALNRSGMPYSDALVANPVVFNASRFLYATGGVASPNVAAAPGRRVYIADLWGRQWKFLTAAPDVPLPVADLGSDQPVATANSILGLPPNATNVTPYVYTTSGNENRASVPATQFKNFGFRDDGSDTSVTVSPAVAQNGINVYPPLTGLFVIPFQDQFRGTVQPSTAYSDTMAGAGRVFFGGTRFNGPNSTFAPPVPPFPCRSSFDSIIYALGAQSGLAAYNLAYGNAYQIFQDSRIVALSTQASPKASVLAKDEGLSKTGTPISPPPPMGLSPSQQATQNIIQAPPAAGVVQPTVRFGSTVCQ
jgi:hypothetical protein